MSWLNELMTYLDPEFLITTFGAIGLWLIVFAESGLFFGFFLPGDSLLFAAGILSHFFSIPFWILVILLCVAAILGDTVGFWFGQKVGPKIFCKEDGLFFKKKYAEEAQKFFEHHGHKAIFLARFIPIVRTFTPIVAGVGNMPYRIFLTYNIVGGIVWTVGFTSAGYFLGNSFPQIKDNLELAIVIIIFVSILPVAWEFFKHKKQQKNH